MCALDKRHAVYWDGITTITYPDRDLVQDGLALAIAGEANALQRAHHELGGNCLFELQHGDSVGLLQSRLFAAMRVHEQGFDGFQHLARVPGQHQAIAGTREEFRVRLGGQPLD